MLAQSWLDILHWWNKRARCIAPASATNVPQNTDNQKHNSKEGESNSEADSFAVHAAVAIAFDGAVCPERDGVGACDRFVEGAKAKGVGFVVYGQVYLYLRLAFEEVSTLV